MKVIAAYEVTIAQANVWQAVSATEKNCSKIKLVAPVNLTTGLPVNAKPVCCGPM
jgi:hypothetical protein